MDKTEPQNKNLEAARFAVELMHQNRTIKEIDFHGFATDEIEFELDRFIHDMFNSKESGCAVICGTGKGIIKKTVLDLLKPYNGGIIGDIIDKGPVLLVVFQR